MPRRAANVNQADVQRIIRACQRENVPFSVTLMPNGAAVFEPADNASDRVTELSDFVRKHRESIEAIDLLLKSQTNGARLLRSFKEADTLAGETNSPEQDRSS